MGGDDSIAEGEGPSGEDSVLLSVTNAFNLSLRFKYCSLLRRKSCPSETVNQARVYIRRGRARWEGEGGEGMRGCRWLG